jgi:hypothetical protein
MAKIDIEFQWCADRLSDLGYLCREIQRFKEKKVDQLPQETDNILKLAFSALKFLHGTAYNPTSFVVKDVDFDRIHVRTFNVESGEEVEHSIPIQKKHRNFRFSDRELFQIGIPPMYVEMVDAAFNAMQRFLREKIDEHNELILRWQESKRELEKDLRARYYFSRHSWLLENRNPDPNPPKVLETVHGVQRLEVASGCVYFLLLKNQVVYVGQTMNLLSRLQSHRKDKEFDDVWFVIVDQRSLSETEKAYIKKFNPPLNRAQKPAVEEKVLAGKEV